LTRLSTAKRRQNPKRWRKNQRKLSRLKKRSLKRARRSQNLSQNPNPKRRTGLSRYLKPPEEVGRSNALFLANVDVDPPSEGREEGHPREALERGGDPLREALEREEGHLREVLEREGDLPREALEREGDPLREAQGREGDPLRGALEREGDPLRGVRAEEEEDEGSHESSIDHLDLIPALSSLSILYIEM